MSIFGFLLSGAMVTLFIWAAIKPEILVSLYEAVGLKAPLSFSNGSSNLIAFRVIFALLAIISAYLTLNGFSG